MQPIEPDPSSAPPGVVGGDPPPGGAPSNPGWVRWVGAAAVTVVVVVAGLFLVGRTSDSGGDVATGSSTTAPADASAQGPGGGAPGGRGTFGTISEIDETTLTIEATQGPPGQDGEGESRTVTVDAGDATVTETVEGTVADLAVGDSILVSGEETDAGVEAATVTETGDTGLGGPGGGGFTPPGEGEGPPDGSFPEGSFPEGSFPEGSFPEGELPEGAPEGGFPPRSSTRRGARTSPTSRP